ncbi:(Fe-S)-binding protein [Mesobacillus selenatarsenatis]|uniref:Predicted L-lactate dehydrogenase, Fe-S oxidoreductase subunit YkgE n=1 Tax=Mesobacillus selenatarsenatis (strain DSM 18680 / JCM 14380 / FERM P-15431 / SF-1) TaxID=1321606 RepID=A0A0A8X9K1_MESS1|nr:(Fe-S)-binding protein [Mesobacillus selenatarsenatis]GAM15904.1 predicted L-lactate dehydrogenase, Fe-S oxidoreductase subunit YkgE [Mesobacillus selenatarsenatis SF-1]
MKVSLFSTCLSDILFADVARNTLEILERVGCEVDYPMEQTCCGQPAYNSGYLQEAKASMKQMMKAFRHSEYVVGPSGSCVSMLKEYPHIFAGDPQWEEEAKAFAAKCYEITEFLVDVLDITDLGSTFKGRVTFHSSCHMKRLLGVKEQPKILLRNVKGVELVELPWEEDCCGFGGTFAVKNPVISQEMVSEKSRHVAETQAEYLVGADMGCLMNIGGRMEREGKKVKIIHITEILNTH